MQNAPQIASPKRRFRTKFIITAGLSVLFGLTLSVAMALIGIQRLGKESSHEISLGLGNANKEYLHNHLADTAEKTDFQLSHAMEDLEILASITQRILDHEQELTSVQGALGEIPTFQNNLSYKASAKDDKGNPTGGWLQNSDKEPVVVSVWGYMLDQKSKAPKPDAVAALQQTALLDLVLPSLQKDGAKKLQLYVVGPEQNPYVRLAPFVDMGSAFDLLYTGHNETPFWKFFFPGIVDGWMLWANYPDKHKDLTTEVTVTAPYDDAAGGGVIMTLFSPLWHNESNNKKTFAGAVGVDLSLDQIISFINDVKLAKTGFAFLSQSNGNVLAVNQTGEKILQLNQGKSADGGGVSILKRFLKDSTDPVVAKLSLPNDDQAHYEEITIGGEPYVFASQRLRPLNFWKGDPKIEEERWTLGFVVPVREVYEALYASEAAIDESTNNIVYSQIAIAIGTLFLVLIGIYVLSLRMTSSLTALTEGATQMSQKRYDVRVPITSQDEIGHLGTVFNSMANEIREYTLNLEGIVKQRTSELEKANREISALNERLKVENLRLGAELDVAQRLQTMVLPQQRELRAIPNLDIDGYMKPADEVGGDYYDVLQQNKGVKIGIGDVTGHGLESGVLMLMVQTAVRTLLAAEEKDPKRFLNIINKVVYQNIQRINLDRNLTLSLLDYSDGKLRLSGQHEEMIVVRNNGELERIDTLELGFPIGLEFDISDFISHKELSLDIGDLVVLYTDGITEAENPQKQQYGIEQLCEVLKGCHKETSKTIKEKIIQDVMRHIGTQKIFDDITLVIIKRSS
jgi:sigma-B regulation protein RsbU (phosphoserine phosphatase)